MRISKLLVITALAGFPLAAQAGKHAPKHVPKISLDDARKTALAKIPGKVKAEELEHEKGRWIYSFEIRPTDEKRKLIKEVNIDSDTGEIVEVDTERD